MADTFRTDLQKLLDEKATGSGIAPSARKINGKPLTSNIVLKSEDFSESVTGTKMVMGLTYRVIRTI